MCQNLKEIAKGYGWDFTTTEFGESGEVKLRNADFRVGFHISAVTFQVKNGKTYAICPDSCIAKETQEMGRYFAKEVNVCSGSETMVKLLGMYKEEVERRLLGK